MRPTWVLAGAVSVLVAGGVALVLSHPTPAPTPQVAGVAPTEAVSASAAGTITTPAVAVSTPAPASSTAGGPVVVPACGGGAQELCPVPGFSGVYAQAGSVYPPPAHHLPPLTPGVHGWLCAVERVGAKAGC